MSARCAPHTGSQVYRKGEREERGELVLAEVAERFPGRSFPCAPADPVRHASAARPARALPGSLHKRRSTRRTFGPSCRGRLRRHAGSAATELRFPRASVTGLRPCPCGMSVTALFGRCRSPDCRVIRATERRACHMAPVLSAGDRGMTLTCAHCRAHDGAYRAPALAIPHRR